jgi:hypothetical protein
VYEYLIRIEPEIGIDLLVTVVVAELETRIVVAQQEHSQLDDWSFWYATDFVPLPVALPFALRLLVWKGMFQ